MNYILKSPHLPGIIGFLSALDIGHFSTYLVRATFKTFHRAYCEAFHFSFIIITHFSQFPHSTQSLAELWGLTGVAIATLTPNNNEQPTELSRLGGFVSIQFSKPE